MDTSTRHIAKQRIQTLFTLAKENINEDPQLAQHYVNTARKIAMSAKIRLPKHYSRQICKHCKSFIPGKNCRVRTRQKREPHIVITCLKCGKHTRIPLDKKKKGQDNEQTHRRKNTIHKEETLGRNPHKPHSQPTSNSHTTEKDPFFANHRGCPESY